MRIDTEKITLSSTLSDKRLESLNLTEQSLDMILSVYYEKVLDTLVEYGKVDYKNLFQVNICTLTPRVHVLRGIPYSSTKRYKLKLSISDYIHDRVSQEYDSYKGDFDGE